MDKANRERILEMFPGLNDPEKVLPLIKRMYEGLTDGLGGGVQNPRKVKGKDHPGITTRLDNLKKQGVGPTGLAKVRKALEIDD